MLLESKMTGHPALRLLTTLMQMEMVKSLPEKDILNSKNLLRLEISLRHKECASLTSLEATPEQIIRLIKKNLMKPVMMLKRPEHAKTQRKPSLRKTCNSLKPWIKVTAMQCSNTLM